MPRYAPPDSWEQARLERHNYKVKSIEQRDIAVMTKQVVRPKEKEVETVKHAVAYFRTSSATNVGQDKDSLARQEKAVRDYAARNDIDIVGEYYDAAVSGADALDEREGFGLLLQRIASNGVRTILVENASRFARDLMVQEIGFRRLQDLGVELIAVDSPSSFIEDTPTAVLIRQILGAVSQFDKAMIVAKLKAARARKKASTGKCEGRKSWTEMDPAMVAMARELRQSGKSLNGVRVALANLGYVSSTGTPFTRSVVSRMVDRDTTVA
jgi:DNA invertase Pin-like site-specific DNA recombinase